jgi:hypothetical protein
VPSFALVGDLTLNDGLTISAFIAGLLQSCNIVVLATKRLQIEKPLGRGVPMNRLLNYIDCTTYRSTVVLPMFFRP